jgi:hypothetical protein
MPVPLILPDIPPAVEIAESRTDSGVDEVLFGSSGPQEASLETSAASLLSVEAASVSNRTGLPVVVVSDTEPLPSVGLEHLPQISESIQQKSDSGLVRVRWNDRNAAYPQTLPVTEADQEPLLRIRLSSQNDAIETEAANTPADRPRDTLADGTWQDGAAVFSSRQQENLATPQDALQDEAEMLQAQGESLPQDALETVPVESDDELPQELEEDEVTQPNEGVELDPNATAPLILRADEQSFDPQRQIVTAFGDVLVQFDNAQLAADRLWVNLENRHIRAEGNVFFNRNEQILSGESAVYNLLQGAGTIYDARGELQLSTLNQDLSLGFPGREGFTNAPIDYRLLQEGSISQVTSPGGLAITTDSLRGLFGTETNNVRRIRFESDEIIFDADGWYAENLRLTNDPFSPPELEFRGSNVRLTPLNEEEDELYIENPRLVFDQGLTIPLFKNRYILRRGQLAAEDLNPLPTSVGFDEQDRGGLFVEREFQVSTGTPWRFIIAPQFYIGRWLGSSNVNLFDPANFGFVAGISGPLGPRTSANAAMSLPGLDLDNFADRLRASFRTQHLIGDHSLNLEYSYRDRLFNGSLGFQDVQSSLGVLLESPNIVLGDTQINLRYQVSGQYVTANTDQPNLLPVGSPVPDLTSLFRFQGAIDLGRGFLLWQGQPLPSTATEGLRYSPRPVVPYLVLGAGLRGVATYYTSNDLQETLEARVSLAGQLGHLQRNYFDYTQFNIGYSKNFIAGEPSPFLFDRVVDQNVLSGGIIQQIYGPLLAGFQTAYNVDTGQEIDTNLILEYRRRAYGLLVSYSPIQETGFIGFRLSDFNWVGRTNPFDSDPDLDNEVIVE